MVRPPMKSASYLGWVVIAMSLALGGCEPEIGDACDLGTDCSDSGDRICDDTVPGGYCTIVNCEPDSCPEEAACVGFRQAPSSLAECADPNELRTLRTFCMRRCSSDGDCRSGYECVDVGEEGNPYDAILTDRESSHSKMCLVPYSSVPAADPDSGASGDYCTAGAYEDDGSYDVTVPTDGEGGAGGMSSDGGAAGMAGSVEEGGTGGV